MRRADGVSLARNASNGVGTTSGGIIGSGDLVATPPGSGLSVNIAAGECIVPGSVSFASTPGGYYLRNTASLNVTGFTANPSNPTIYAIVATINDAAYHGAVNSGVIQAIAGTPSSGASLTNLTGAPAIPDASLLLAWILVPAAATNIITADILNASSFQFNSTIDQYTAGQSAYAFLGLPNFGLIRDSSAGNKTLIANQHYIVSTGSPTYTLPVPFPGCRIKVTNFGSGAPVVSHNASEVIYGPGQGASGAASITLGAYGATVTLESDGTSWYETVPTAAPPVNVGATGGAGTARTNASFAALTTPCSATITINTIVKVTITGNMTVGTSTGQIYLGVVLSGANTVAATTAKCLLYAASTGFQIQSSRILYLSGLTPGSTTFALQYASDGTASNTVASAEILVECLN